MPELPEVEAARRALEDHCVGKRILKCTAADDTKVIDGVSRADFESSLPGKSIVSVHRKGKNLWIRLDSPPFPSFQFGMTGAFYIKGVAVTKYKRSAVSESEEWPSKFSKVFLVLDDGLEVSFTDKRRFAKVRLLDDPESAPPISALGPDALYEPMQVDELAGLLSKKKIPIKALLLDQGCISGIGNWVADEVLYQARIHPEQTAATLSKESCESLHKAIKEVLETALEVGADSTQYPINWIFHSREKKPGNTHVNGKKIEFIIAGGRTTAYVPELQKLSGNATVKAATARSKKPKKNIGGKNGSDSEKEKDEAQTAKKGSKKPQKKGGDMPKKPEKGMTKKLAKAEEGPSKKRAKPSKASHDDADEDEQEIPDKGTGKKQTKSEEGPSKKRAKPSKAIIDAVDEDEPQNPEEGTEKKHAKTEKEPSKKITKPSKASRDDVDEDKPQNPEKVIGKKQAKAESSKKMAKPSKASHDDVDKDEPQKPEKDTGKKRAKTEEEPSKKSAKSSKASRDDGVEDEPQKPGKGTTKKQEKAEEEPSKKRGKPSKAEEEPSKKRGKPSKAEEEPSKKMAKPSKASHDDVDKDEPQKPEKDTGKKRAKTEEEPSKKSAKSSKASRDDGVEDEPQKPGKGTTKKQEKAEEEPSKKRGKPSKAEEEPSKKRGKSSKAGVQQKK